MAKKRYGMVIDLDKCVGCKACSAVCTIENHVPLGSHWNNVMQLGPEGDMSKGEMDMFFFPRQCMHCENPSCIEVCPTKATYQTDDGVVLIDSTRCFGCQYCMWACPYDARVIDPVKKVAQKCILCVHKLERGQLPECVKTCVSCARTAGDLNDPQSDISQLLSREWQRAFKIHEDFDNNPAVIYLKPRKGASKL